MAKIVSKEKIGRGYWLALVQQFDHYNVELHMDYNTEFVVTITTGCIGRGSGDFWMDSTTRIMKKIIFMADSIDMAMHNVVCYSRNMLLSSPKDGFENEWRHENDKANMLKEWMYELTGYWGKDSDVTKNIREIFADYIHDQRA